MRGTREAEATTRSAWLGSKDRPEVCRGCSPDEYGIDGSTQVIAMSAPLCMFRLKLGWTNRNWMDRGLVPALPAA